MFAVMLNSVPTPETIDMEDAAPAGASSWRHGFNVKLQYVLDKSAPHVLYRWIGYGVVFSLYGLRVYMVNGWFVVTYGLGIYLLNQFIGFLTPQFDPEQDEEFSLPTRDSEEYRPFARRLPEFKFWLACLTSTLMALGMTFFSIFDIPVFWPLLLFYFIVLFIVTMQKQIKHMIKHRYVPFSWGKATYGSGSGDSLKDKK